MSMLAYWFSKPYLSLGAVFAVFAGFYYWVGNIAGVQYPELFGQIHFWSTFIGVNLTFFPQHFLGLAGMPRRIPTYPDSYAEWNAISTLGSYISFTSALFFVVIVWVTFTYGKVANSNPWDFSSQLQTKYSFTLEWLLPSPLCYHSFDQLPVIKYISN